ncbi:hypothetical protein J8J14_09495 [Roseomonas sp. SSH11]|uniref:Uncharacterized protein n=1 Tax=Pararoseomonas baculiformis TaxID=2820812 RepID=A0ABS4AER4_9PROT|nr:hypothetical protein [Pararoseomonas baculiformis]MBP0445013.1 hypothetical protein [Pararoseomonas baculiformis]
MATFAELTKSGPTPNDTDPLFSRLVGISASTPAVMNRRAAHAMGLCPKPKTAAEGLLLYKPKTADASRKARAAATPPTPVKSPAKSHRATPSAPQPAGSCFGHLNGGAIDAPPRMRQEVKREPAAKGTGLPDTIAAMQRIQGTGPVRDLANSSDPADRAAALILGPGRR